MCVRKVVSVVGGRVWRGEWRREEERRGEGELEGRRGRSGGVIWVSGC